MSETKASVRIPFTVYLLLGSFLKTAMSSTWMLYSGIACWEQFFLLVYLKDKELLY